MSSKRASGVDRRRMTVTAVSGFSTAQRMNHWGALWWLEPMTASMHPSSAAVAASQSSKAMVLRPQNGIGGPRPSASAGLQTDTMSQAPLLLAYSSLWVLPARSTALRAAMSAAQSVTMRLNSSVMESKERRWTLRRQRTWLAAAAGRTDKSSAGSGPADVSMAGDGGGVHGSVSWEIWRGVLLMRGMMDTDCLVSVSWLGLQSPVCELQL